jgi:hypothetical protein
MGRRASDSCDFVEVIADTSDAEAFIDVRCSFLDDENEYENDGHQKMAKDLMTWVALKVETRLIMRK